MARSRGRRGAPGGGRRGRRGTLRAAPLLRLRVGFVVIAVVLSAFAARLVQLQGIDPAQYAQMAAAEGQVSIVLPAERGEILDRAGEPLATSVDGLMIVADPTLTAQRAPELATFLSQRLGLDYITTLDRLRRQDKRFQYIARQVPAAEARTVLDEAKRLDFVGLDSRDDPVRFYPAGEVGANVVGFLGTPNADGSARPLSGLETDLNTVLSGTDGEARYQVGANGRRIPLGDNTIAPAVDGADVTLTIDRDLQFECQRVIADAVRGSGGDSGYAVLMDSRTGEILCLADYPTFDASHPERSSEDDRYSHAVSDIYEPGSVEKVLTVAGLIDAGKVSSRTRFKVPEVLDGDQPIHDWFDHATDELRLTLAGIIAKSSNIGTVLAASKYDPGELRAYLTAFGLGTATDIGLSTESDGLLPGGTSWTDPIGARIAFGQSVSVNAIQMTAAVNTIANGGVRVDPSLVRGIVRTDAGGEVGTGTATQRRVVSKDAARQTMQMMELVVNPETGTAPGAAVPGYRVAGKTGTAQYAGQYGYTDKFTVSFAGFAPADDPRFTAYVVVQNPRNNGGGGSVAGPAFAKIMAQAFHAYPVAPTGTRPSRLPVEW